MRLQNVFGARMRTVVAGGALIALASAGTAVAVGQITSTDIKDGTIQTRDLTKNNFARFTSTESVVSGVTPVSTVAGFNSQRVVAVAANVQVPLTTIVLDKGTWKISGSGQFWHMGPGTPSGADYGVISVAGLENGFLNSYTADVPDGGGNAAQTAFSGTLTITANDTPVVIQGSFTGGNAGQAGASVTATQYVYVAQFSHGH
jgi:hypothetical protein